MLSQGCFIGKMEGCRSALDTRWIVPSGPGRLPLPSCQGCSGLAFHLNGLILPDDEVADLEVEGLFSPGVHAQLSQVSLAVAFVPLQA